MDTKNVVSVNEPKRLKARIFAAFALALALAVSAYLMINASKANNIAFGSFWFLAVLPAYLCALICYVGDPERDRPIAFYWLVPPALCGIVVLGSIVVLREGVICLIMLSPIWLVSGWAGAFLLRWRRKRPVDPGVFHSSLLLFPLMMGGVEAQMPMPHDGVTVTRQTVVDATPAEIWPYAVANAHIDEREGRWTFSQNIIGVPRPRATVMHGQGEGAVRTALWGDHVNFDEHITRWQPGHILGWTFAFTNTSLLDYTDKHISPDGQFLKVDAGDYTIQRLSTKQTLLILHTHYVAMTHVNLYAEIWGQLFLGDVENNILAIIKHRAEAAHRGSV